MALEKEYLLVEELATSAGTIQPESIVSRTFLRENGLKAISFGFAPGQELSEHTASVAAILQIISGSATVTLGEDVYELESGAWAYMKPRLKHSIVAKTPVTMLLLMLEQQ